MSARATQTSWRQRTGLGLGISAGVALVVLLVANATAAPVSAKTSTVTDAAPYSGTEYTSLIIQPSGCGTGATLPVLPYFDLDTGIGFESIGATAASCGSENSTVYAESAAGFVSTAFKAKAGTDTLTANWVLNFAVDLVATHGSGTEAAHAEFAVFLDFELIDTTTNSMVYQSNYPELYDLITSGSYVHTYSAIPETVDIYSSLVKGQMYEYEAVAYAAVLVFVTPGANSASATVTMGSGGEEATLSSLTRN